MVGVDPDLFARVGRVLGLYLSHIANLLSCYVYMWNGNPLSLS